MKAKYNVESFSKTTILDKLSIVYSASLLTLLVRLREETRGGELIELAYLAITFKGDKIWFLKKEGFPLSTMVKEILVALRIRLATFDSNDKLVDEAERIIRNELTQ